jgi:hypothetical protein
MHSRTSHLRDLARALNCMVVVTPQKPSIGAGFFAEAPSEILTASCRDSGLSDAYDNGFEED